MAEATAAKLSKKDFVSDQEVRWCPGCGDARAKKPGEAASVREAAVPQPPAADSSGRTR